jgi:hypothetical protein
MQSPGRAAGWSPTTTRASAVPLAVRRTLTVVVLRTSSGMVPCMEGNDMYIGISQELNTADQLFASVDDVERHVRRHLGWTPHIYTDGDGCLSVAYYVMKYNGRCDKIWDGMPRWFDLLWRGEWEVIARPAFPDEVKRLALTIVEPDSETEAALGCGNSHTGDAEITCPICGRLTRADQFDAEIPACRDCLYWRTCEVCGQFDRWGLRYGLDGRRYCDECFDARFDECPLCENIVRHSEMGDEMCVFCEQEGASGD